MRKSVLFRELDPESFYTTLAQKIDEAASLIQMLSHEPKPTYQNVLLPLDKMLTTLLDFHTLGQHMENVLGTSAWRESCRAGQDIATRFFSDIRFNRRLYETICAIDSQCLGPLESRHLIETKRRFELGGVALDNDDQASLVEVEISLNHCTAAFHDNVIRGAAHLTVEVAPEALAGLPEALISNAKTRGRRLGRENPVVDASPASLGSILEFVSVRNTREKLWRIAQDHASTPPFDNRNLVKKILRLRRRKATLLGFDDAISLNLQTRMITSKMPIERLLEELTTICNEWSDERHRELCEFVRQELNNPKMADAMMPWDLAFCWTQFHRKAEHLDPKLLAPYLDLSSVLSGIFKLLNTTFGIEFQTAPQLSRWHDDVLNYKVLKDGELVGIVHLDLIQRPGKKLGTWMCPLRQSTSNGGPRCGVIVASLRRMHGSNNSTLTHRQLQSLLHEFGHLLHHILSEVAIGALSGTNVPLDFVEFPAQFMENWCWSPEALKVVLRHRSSRTPPPSELLQMVVDTRQWQSWESTCKTVSLATLDWKIHQANPHEDVHALARAHLVEHSKVPLAGKVNRLETLVHLFASPSGYAAGYYGYLSAEMMAADAFEQFEHIGVLSSKTGRRFRETILATGNGRSVMDSYVAFQGRKPNKDAWLRRLGIREIKEA